MSVFLIGFSKCSKIKIELIGFSRDLKKLADNVTKEQGKTLPDAEGDVIRGLQVVEHACSAPSLLLGEYMPSVSKDMDTYSYRIPLGVTAGIAPFVSYNLFKVQIRTIIIKKNFV